MADTLALPLKTVLFQNVSNSQYTVPLNNSQGSAPDLTTTGVKGSPDTLQSDAADSRPTLMQARNQQVQHDDQQTTTSVSQSQAGAWHEINNILRRQLRNNRPWFLIE